MGHVPSVNVPNHLTKGSFMQIDKEKVLDLIKSKGDAGQASQADKELPDKVDPEKDSAMLTKFGIKPQDLLGKL